MSGLSWVRVGALVGALGVIAGAFGAHGLFPSFDEVARLPSPERLLMERRMANFETAAKYQMYHALAIVAVGAVGLAAGRSRGLDVAGVSFLLGVAIFSGTLYGIGLGGPRWLGAITPVGGVGMIVGWLALATSRVVGPASKRYDLGFAHDLAEPVGMPQGQ